VAWFAEAGTAEYCCIRKDDQLGWALVWDDAVPPVGCELTARPGSPPSIQDQRNAFFSALSQVFISSISPPAPVSTLTKLTSGDDGFLRFTFRIPDARVDSINGIVVPGTFLSPFRDGQKIVSGFEAVGRFALPVRLPYKHPVLLAAPVNASVDIGTVVPNFGQADGGVEAVFAQGFSNLHLHYHALPSY
jgi:hypothetical protein